MSDPSPEKPVEEVVDAEVVEASEKEEVEVKVTEEEGGVESAVCEANEEGVPSDDPQEEEEGDAGSKEDENPLVMDSSLSAAKPTKSKKKKKKAAAPAAAAPADSSANTPALEMVTARLAELTAKESSPKAEVETQAPHQIGLKLLAEGGEPCLREAYQQNIQLAKKIERELILMKRRGTNLQKEKERLHLDTAEVKGAQHRVQLKCKEVQHHIKALKEACATMETEKLQQRNELENKFQTAIDEISSKLEDGNTERENLRKENEDLDIKVKSIESDCNARFDKYQELHDERSGELAVKKKVELEVEATSLEERLRGQKVEQELHTVLRSVLDLTQQIKMYSERMVEFESSIVKSKDVFGTFGKEIERMREHTERLTVTRDEAKDDLAALSKRIVDYNDERQRLRRQIESQTRDNTKTKESAQKLTAKRAQWKPYTPYVQAWKDSQRDEDEETADTTPSNGPTHTDPAKQTDAEAEKSEA